MKFIAIDLELEQPNTRQDTSDSEITEEKIIQVGIVCFEISDPDPVVLHSETIFIHYPGKISTYIKKLTSIEDEQVNSSQKSPFLALLRIAKIREEYDTSRQIVEWGSGDVKALLAESGVSEENFNQKMGFARNTINAKVLFQCYALANNIKMQSGLSKSMSKLNLDFKNTIHEGKNKGAHWAETDALNTARIFNKIINLIKK